jgi:hypothetical protein
MQCGRIAYRPGRLVGRPVRKLWVTSAAASADVSEGVERVASAVVVPCRAGVSVTGVSLVAGAVLRLDVAGVRAHA